jgi:hypothetical protein
MGYGSGERARFKILRFDNILTEGKQRSENGVRPKTLFLELIFQQPQNLNNSFLNNNNSLIPQELFYFLIFVTL